MIDKSNDLYELPESWEWIKLGEICAITDRDHKTPKYTKRGIPLISPKNFLSNGIDFDSVKYVVEDELVKFKRKCNPDIGDILYSRIGTIGEAWIVDFKDDFVALHSIAMVKPNYEISNSKYILYLLKTSYIKNLALSNVKSVGTPDLGLERIRNFKIPLPPLNEQHRIAEKIEELFTRLDAGVEELKKIKEQLKRYHQSVLKHAFEGKLTEEWREKHLDELEPASELLEEIKDEHKKDIRRKQKKLSSLDASNLPELPEKWFWTNVGEVSDKIHYGYTEKATNKPVGPRFLRISDIQENRVDWNSVPYCKISNKEKEKYILSEGDLVFARTGATVGKSYLISGRIPEAIFASYLIRIIFNKILNKKFMSYFFRSSFYWRQIHEGKIGIGQPNVNATKLSQLVVSIPPFDEQYKIVDEIERRFSLSDEIEKIVDLSLKQSVSLRQSILKKAFEGKLVPQDPTDEPAVKLLERIKKEKAKKEEEKGSKRRKKKKKKNEKSKYKQGGLFEDG